MSGNRVEELEAEVRRLQATIEGLTDELVETKERLETIEAETGVEPDVIEGRLARSRPNDASTASEADGEGPTERSTDRETDEEDATDAGGDDIIVA